MFITNHEITIIISLFSLGLFGGFSHCIGMCGPFVLSQVHNRLENIKISKATQMARLKGIALLPYHLGRATTYSILGGLSSFFAANLKNFSEFKYTSALLLITSAFIFIGVAFNIKLRLPFKINLIENFPSLGLEKNSFTKFIKDKIQKILALLFSKPYNLNGYFLGTLLGFIPCGLLYGAFITAASIDNYFIAALAMFCFAIGTIPSLFITAYGGYLFFQKLKNKLKFFTKVILLLNSLTLFIMALGLIFNRI